MKRTKWRSWLCQRNQSRKNQHCLRTRRAALTSKSQCVTVRTIKIITIIPMTTVSLQNELWRKPTKTCRPYIQQRRGQRHPQENGIYRPAHCHLAWVAPTRVMSSSWAPELTARNLPYVARRRLPRYTDLWPWPWCVGIDVNFARLSTNWNACDVVDIVLCAVDCYVRRGSWHRRGISRWFYSRARGHKCCGIRRWRDGGRQATQGRHSKEEEEKYA